MVKIFYARHFRCSVMRKKIILGSYLLHLKTKPIYVDFFQFMNRLSPCIFLRFRFLQTFNFFQFHPKTSNRNKTLLCFHSLLLSRLKQTNACFLWKKMYNYSFRSCTLLGGLEPPTFRLTADCATKAENFSNLLEINYVSKLTFVQVN